MLRISLSVSCKHLLLDLENNFYSISLSILVTCLLGNVWILQGGLPTLKERRNELCKRFSLMTVMYL